jgi:hypothetical protein
METKKKVNIPKKGAARKWAEKLRKLREQEPPQDLVDAINGKKRKETDIAAASPTPPRREMEI